MQFPGTDAIGDDGMVTGTIIYDKITAVSSGVTEAIFEKAESGDSEVENPQTEDPEANSDENGSQEQNSTSAAGQDNGKRINKNKTDSDRRSYQLYSISCGFVYGRRMQLWSSDIQKKEKTWIKIEKSGQESRFTYGAVICS